MKGLSKDRYDETFAGEDDVCVKISEYPPWVFTIYGCGGHLGHVT